MFFGAGNWKMENGWELFGGTCNDCNDKTNSKFTVQMTGNGWFIGGVPPSYIPLEQMCTPGFTK